MATQGESGGGIDEKKAEDPPKDGGGFVRTVLPHIALLAFFFLYLCIGGLIIGEIEISEAKKKALPYLHNLSHPARTAFIEKSEIWGVRNSILYCFVTITTIGYGNVVPKTVWGRFFCMFYSIIGVTLFGLCMANVGRFTSEFCWSLLWALQKMGLYQRKNCYGGVTDKKPSSDLAVPFWLILVVFTLWLVIGTLMFPWYESMGLLDSLYFTFISLTTIGYGDFYPENLDWMILTILYLMVGLSLNMVAIQILGDFLQKFHHFGKDVEDAANTRIWFGGQELEVGDLVESVAKRLGADPSDVGMVLKNLDNIVSTTIAEKKDEAKYGKKPEPKTPDVEVEIYVKTPKGVVKRFSSDGTSPVLHNSSTENSAAELVK